MLKAALLWGAALYGQVLTTPTSEEQRLLAADTRSLLHCKSEAGSSYASTDLADMESRDEREAAAHVQIITVRQLEAFGVRSLAEALQLIPGFSLALDTDNAIGIGIHGIGAMEGKCLFMLDGKQLNENDLGKYALGHRIPLANVERIEVIIGPSSLVHGEYAALGVVNIVTRTAEHGTGNRAEWWSGFANGGHTHSQVSLSGSHRISKDQDLSYLVGYTRGNRSNASYFLADSTPVTLADSTGSTTSSFQLAYRWKSLKASMVYMDEVYAVSGAGHMVQMRDVVIALEQRSALSERVEFAWQATQTDQHPWYYLNTTSPERLSSNTSNQRTTAQAAFLYRPRKSFTVRGGFQGYLQTSTYQWHGAGGARHFSGEARITYNSLAWFTEASWRGRLGDLLAGYRQEHHVLTGMYTAPRIAFTRVVGRFHGKLIWSEAYRIPTIMNLNHGPDERELAGERITSLEGEIGFRFGRSLRTSVNTYRTCITDPIVHVGDNALRDKYLNEPFVGTEGIDARLQVATPRTNVLAGLGSYRTFYASTLPHTSVEGTGYQVPFGLPGTRLLLAIGHQLTPGISLRLNGHWQSHIRSLHHTGKGSEMIQWAPQTMVNAGIGVRPGKDRRTSIDLSCENMLDTSLVLVAPRSSALMPYQRNGRTWSLGLTYKFIR